MSDFSPQAQAVLDASHFPQRWEHAIAAALRAATDHLKSIDPDDNAYSAGYDTAISDLLAIAYELDGNYPEKPDDPPILGYKPTRDAVVIHAMWKQRQHLRALLTDEADRAERSD